MATSPSHPRHHRRGVLQGAGAAVAVGGAALGLNAISPGIWPERPLFGLNRSHWARALPAPNPPPTRDLDADFVVIGGGFTGLSAAYYLRQVLPQAKVVLLEAVRCGNGASARNGAMLQTSTEDTYMEPDVDPVFHRRLYAVTRDNIERIRRLQAVTGVDCELDTRGALQVAFTQRDAQAMPRIAAKLRAAGLPVDDWGAEDVAQALGTRAYHGGLYEPASGQVHPGKLVALWKRAAELSGAEIYEGAAVTAVDEGPRLSLHLANGITARSPHVVLATNVYTSRLGYLRAAVAPIVNHVAITPPLGPSELAALGWSRRIPFNDSRTNVVYAGLTRDNRVHIGGGVEQYEFDDGLADPADHGAALGFLRRELARLYPSLADAPFERSWWGFVDMSVTGASSVGRMGRHGNILYAIGLSGQGVNFTSVLGRVLGDIAAGKERGWSWLPYLNHLPPYVPNEPFRWLGVEAGIGLLSR